MVDEFIAERREEARREGDWAAGDKTSTANGTKGAGTGTSGRDAPE